MGKKEKNIASAAIGNTNAKAIAKIARSVFGNKQSHRVRYDDYMKIQTYLFDYSLYDDAVYIDKKTNRIDVITVVAVNRFNYLVGDVNRHDDLRKMFSQDYIYQATMRDQHSIVSSIGKFCNHDLKEPQELDKKLVYMEKICPNNGEWESLVTSSAMEPFQNVLRKELAAVNDSDGLKTVLNWFQTGTNSSSMKRPDMKKVFNNGMWERTKSLIRRDLSSAKSDQAIRDVISEYKFITACVDKIVYDSWSADEARKVATELAIQDLRSTTDYETLIKVYNTYDDLKVDVTTVPEFIDMFVSVARNIISGYHDVEDVDKLTAPFNEKITPLVNDVLFKAKVELVIIYIKRCDSSHSSLNNALNRTSADDVKINNDVCAVYSNRALEILTDSPDIATLTANYQGIVMSCISKARKVNELNNTYANAAFDLLRSENSKEIPELKQIDKSFGPQKALANTVDKRINEILSDSLFAWCDYYEGMLSNDSDHIYDTVYWDLAYTIGFGLLQSNPKMAGQYLVKVKNRDTDALKILAMIGEGIDCLRNNDIEGAKSAAKRAKSVSSEMIIAGIAFETYVKSVEGSATKDDIATVIDMMLKTRCKESSIVSTSLNYIAMAFATSYPASLTRDIISLSSLKESEDDGDEQSKVLPYAMTTLINLLNAMMKIDLWRFEEASELIDKASRTDSDAFFEKLIGLLEVTVKWGTGSDREDSRNLKEYIEYYESVDATKLELFCANKIAGYLYESEESWPRAINYYTNAKSYTDVPTELNLMIARLQFINSEYEDCENTLGDQTDDLSELLRIMVMIKTLPGSAQRAKVKRELERIKSSDNYINTYKAYIAGLSNDAADVWQTAVEYYTKALDGLDKEGSRQASLLAVDLYLARAKANVNLSRDNLGIANGDIESAFDVLYRFSENMVDIQQLKKRLEMEKKSLGEGRGSKEAIEDPYANSFTVISFEGIDVNMQGGPLGTGGTFKVFRAVDATDGRKYAVRMHSKVNPYAQKTVNITNEEIKALDKEYDIWEAATEEAGEYVVNLISYRPNTHYPAALMEYADRVYSNEEARMSMKERMEVCYSLLKALDRLHNMGVVHNDVKPDNMLEVMGRWKLSDFDISFEEGDQVPTTKGTPEYKSPEHFNNGKLTTKSDIWAAGVVVFRALRNVPRYPFEGSGKQYEENVKAGNFKGSLIKEQYLPLMTKVFSVNPDERPDAAEFLKELKQANGE